MATTTTTTTTTQKRYLRLGGLWNRFSTKPPTTLPRRGVRVRADGKFGAGDVVTDVQRAPEALPRGSPLRSAAPTGRLGILSAPTTTGTMARQRARSPSSRPWGRTRGSDPGTPAPSRSAGVPITFPTIAVVCRGQGGTVRRRYRDRLFTRGGERNLPAISDSFKARSLVCGVSVRCKYRRGPFGRIPYSDREKAAALDGS